MIKIGKASYPTRKPADLDAALLETTGCNAAEAALHLMGWPGFGRIASALRPFLPDEAPSTPELAAAIAQADDGPEILIAVKKLYADRGIGPSEAAASAEA